MMQSDREIKPVKENMNFDFHISCLRDPQTDDHGVSEKLGVTLQPNLF